ncbi:hypothetical protein [Flavobacterium adhaerens]|uniref:hypothetical protein n=1 Tax=Flavobacterium adhaerens TaxID=3149043 RepID=UPI0032B43CA5
MTNSLSEEQNQTTQPYYGDLEKTQKIYQLVQTPNSERDDNWNSEFLSNIVAASFKCGEPQVITGPDGFPYFQLFLPEPNVSFQCFVIEKMKDDFLLEYGYGVVINPTAEEPDWVLSYGDIVNLHLNNTFYSNEPTLFSKRKKTETITKSEQVLIGQPSETLLPIKTRKVLESFLKYNGIESPKVLLLMRQNEKKEIISQDLAFNITPNDFESEAIYQNVMLAFAWFLPRHYSCIGLSEANFSDVFQPL